MNNKVIILFAATCFSTITSAAILGGKNVELNSLMECAKDKKCGSFCVGNKLNFVSNTGDLDTNKIPFFDSLKQFDVNSCITNNKQTEKCEKYNSITNCMKKVGLKAFSENSQACSKESKIDEIKPTYKTMMALVTKPNSYSCYIRCMLLKFEIVDENNQPKMELFDKVMKEKGYKVDDIAPVVRNCVESSKTTDKCSQASKIVMCIGKKAVSKLGLSQLTKLKGMIM